MKTPVEQAATAAQEALLVCGWKRTRWPFNELEICPSRALLSEAEGLEHLAVIVAQHPEEESAASPERYRAAALAVVRVYVARAEEGGGR